MGQFLFALEFGTKCITNVSVEKRSAGSVHKEKDFPICLYDQLLGEVCSATLWSASLTIILMYQLSQGAGFQVPLSKLLPQVCA